MKTLIEGGWVVAFNGTSHEVYENGSVVYENDHIVHAGGPYTGTVDTRLSARGKLVSPGFINTHVHTTGNGGDYMLHDMAKNTYRTANYLSFAAPLKGLGETEPPLLGEKTEAKSRDRSPQHSLVYAQTGCVHNTTARPVAPKLARVTVLASQRTLAVPAILADFSVAAHR